MSENIPQNPSPSVPHFPNGEYQIEGILGAGGMAVVYRARDLRRPRTVAIKVLRSAVVKSIGTERFLREIAVTAGFSHPHILPLLDSGKTTDESGQPVLYYVMPLVESESLAGRIERESRLPLTDALRLTRGILEALQYAHHHGVVHRDIKPANVLISGGHAVVADFGVARPVRGLHASDADDITEVGIIVGTPTYMSPEQALGDTGVDERSDIYAVGCVLYEMLTGVPPFEGRSGQSLVTRKLSGAFLPAASVRSGMPPDIDAVLKVALSPEAADRYPSAEAFLHAIEGLEHRSGASQATEFRKTKRPMRSLVVAAVLLVSTIAVATYALRNRTAQSAPVAALAAPDKTRLAVLPLESIVPDSTMDLVANALTVDMIDELAQYPALTVISRNGVLRFRGGAARVDSVAKVLNVGSIVAGDIRRNGDQVRITVRLIDGITGAQLASADASGAMRDVLRVRSSVIDSVTSFLRKQIGKELRAGERRGASSAEAWELLARAQQIMNDGSKTWIRLAPLALAEKYAGVDSLVTRAIALDPKWNTPVLYRGTLRLAQANMQDLRGSLSDSALGARLPTAKQLRLQAVEFANTVLSRTPDDPKALFLRGRSTLDLWRTASPVAPDSLRAAAESDLRDAVIHRRDLAQAWNNLSELLNMTGDFEESRAAAETALKADAFLDNAPAVIGRLFFTSLANGRPDVAAGWCTRGQTQYPTAPQFWMCELTLLGWTGRTPADVAAAWRALHASEARDTSNILASGWGTRRMLVAAVAARAGLADSAQAIARRVRDALPSGANTSAVDFGEAHVHALLGHPDQAIALIERYLKENPALRGQVRRSPWFASLNKKDRFLAITAPQ